MHSEKHLLLSSSTSLSESASPTSLPRLTGIPERVLQCLSRSSPSVYQPDLFGEVWQNHCPTGMAAVMKKKCEKLPRTVPILLLPVKAAFSTRHVIVLWIRWV